MFGQISARSVSDERQMPAFAQRAAALALEALSPTRCACCERPGVLLCDACRADMVRVDPVLACPRCGAPFGALLCTECREPDPNLGRVFAAAVFEGVPATVVRTYKDAGERRLGAVIARGLHESLREAERLAPDAYAGILSEADALTFVPVTAAAMARRGFDHMEEVARRLSDLAGVPFVDALAKRGAYDQRDLGRAGRIARARDAYEAVADVAGMRLLLVDDVITTGATLSAAAAELSRAGAAHVDACAWARVW